MTVKPYVDPTEAPVSHQEIIQGVGVPFLSGHMGLNYSTVYGWVHRNSVPPEWFCMVVHYSRQPGAGRPTSLLELARWPEWTRIISND